MATPKEKMRAPAALILAFGKKAKGGEKSSPDASSDEGDYEEEPSEIPPDFEEYAVQAFPELDGDPDRLMAHWKSIQACVAAAKG